MQQSRIIIALTLCLFRESFAQTPSTPMGLEQAQSNGDAVPKDFRPKGDVPLTPAVLEAVMACTLKLTRYRKKQAVEKLRRMMPAKVFDRITRGE